MEVEARKGIDRRLARVEGQVRGLRRMISESVYCCDVLVQLAAVSAALDQVAAEVAADHVEACIVGHGSGTDHPQARAMTQSELVDELRLTLKRLVR